MNAPLNSSLQGSNIQAQGVPGTIATSQIPQQPQTILLPPQPILQQPIQNPQYILQTNPLVAIPQSYILQTNPQAMAVPQVIQTSQPNVMQPFSPQLSQSLLGYDKEINAEFKPNRETRIAVVVFAGLLLLFAFVNFIVDITYFKCTYQFSLLDCFILAILGIVIIFYYWKSDNRVYKQLVGTITLVYWFFGLELRIYQMAVDEDYHYDHDSDDRIVFEIFMNIFRSIFMLTAGIIILCTIRSYRL